MVAVVGAGVALATTKQNPVASWTGLLEHGVGRCEEVVRHLAAGWATRVRDEIRSGDLDDLLSAAGKIAAKLGAPRGGEYRRWLRETVGSLTVADDTVMRAIADLGVPLTITNYDGLLEEVTGLRAFTWLDYAAVERLLRGDERGVLHLHGYWERPKSVILDIRSYERALHDEHFQTVLRALRTVQTFLFIGYGAGLQDPNFGGLLRWSRSIFAESEHRHFRLALNSEVDRRQMEHDSAERIFVIGYGDSHADLAPFLRELVPDHISTVDPVTPAGAGELTPAEEAKIDRASESPNNLPHPVSTFVGRVSQIAEVEQLLLTPSIRLVTLTGTGGVGKTRLALEVARRLLEHFPEGVWYVQLGALPNPELVTQKVGSALGVRDTPDRRPLLEVLEEHIQTNRMLIVLNTCDNFVPECARLADTLLRSCSKLKILATSRESLDAEGEIRWEVPPLAVPNTDWPIRDVKLCDSVRLFTQRATEAKPSFRLTDFNARTVSRICQQLDGIPLAIELAARRIADLGTVEQIEARLRNRFTALIKKSPAGPPRQRTMHATIAWSYSLLNKLERNLFNRLAVFAGGWTLEMAEAICSGPEVERAMVMNLLAVLVHKSLVISIGIQAQARYRMLDSIREYATEQVSKKGELETTQRKHVDYFVALTTSAKPELWGPEQVVWVTRLETEHDNLRAALRWSVDNAPEAALQLVANVWRFWQLRSYFREGLQWAEAALAKSPNQTVRQAEVLLGAAYLARSLWDMKEAKELTEKSITLFEQFGDDRGRGMATRNLAILARVRGDYALARELLEQSLQQALEAEDQRAIGARLTGLGITALFAGRLEEAQEFLNKSLPILREWGERHMLILALRFLGLLNQSKGEYGQAQRLYLESREVAESIGDKVEIGAAVCHLGDLAQVEGDYPKARKLLLQSLSILRDTGDRMEEAWTLDALGILAYAQGRYKMAETFHRGSLSLFRRTTYKRGMARCLCLLGMLRIKEGDQRGGLRLIAAATASQPVSSILAGKQVHDRYEVILKTVREALTSEIYSAVWQGGRAIDLSQAVDQVLAE